MEHVPGQSDHGYTNYRNTSSGDAENVVQAHTIHGDVHLNQPGNAPSILGGLPPVGLFTGRTKDIRRVVSALTSDTAVTAVTGLPGVGKTSLAVKVAHDLVAEGLFAGTLFLDARGYGENPHASQGQSLDSFLRALGVPVNQIPLADEDKATLYRDILAGRPEPILVIVDNVAGSHQVRPLLPGTGRHRVLITSRHRIADLDDTRLIELALLDGPEALSLIRAALHAADPDDVRTDRQPEATTELAELCGLLPLALRVAAAMLVSDRQDSVSDLVEELRESPSIVRELRSGSLDVPAVFNLSYRSLEPELARLFRLLALNPGEQVSVDAAAALAGEKAGTVRKGLRELRRAHLIEHARPPEYVKFHDLLRAYAVDCAQQDETEADRDAAIERLLDHYMETAKAAGRHLQYKVPTAERATARFPNRQSALEWFEIERTNLVAATDLAAAHFRRWGQLLRLPGPLGHSLTRRHLSAEWKEIVDAALRRLLPGDGVEEDSADVATLCNRLGLLRQVVQDHEQALESHSLALALYGGIGNISGQAETLQFLGWVHRDRGSVDQALGSLNAALELYRSLGDERGQVQALEDLGLTHHLRGDYRQAVTDLSEATRRCGDLGDPDSHALLLHELGESQFELGELIAATGSLTEALTRHRQLRDRAGQAMDLDYLGAVYRRQGRTGYARSTWAEALALWSELGDDERADEMRQRLIDMDGG